MGKQNRRKLARIERKLDIIIKLIQHYDRLPSGNIFDRLHKTAKNLQEQCEREKNIIEKILRR